MVRSSNIHIFAGGRVSKRKPSPDIYNLAKGTLGVDAADCLVIEDDEVRLAPALAPPRLPLPSAPPCAPHVGHVRQPVLLGARRSSRRGWRAGGLAGWLAALGPRTRCCLVALGPRTRLLPLAHEQEHLAVPARPWPNRAGQQDLSSALSSLPRRRLVAAYASSRGGCRAAGLGACFVTWLGRVASGAGRAGSGQGSQHGLPHNHLGLHPEGRLQAGRPGGGVARRGGPGCRYEPASVHGRPQRLACPTSRRAPCSSSCYLYV
jgi:hypothetical protein